MGMKTMIPRHRVRFAGLILLLGLLAVGGRLVWLQVVSAEELLASRYEIDVAGTRVGARASLRPLYDPKSERVRA